MRTRSSVVVLACSVVAAACVGPPAPAASPGPPAVAGGAFGSAAAGPLAGEARVGVADPELAALLVDHLEVALRAAPVWATTLGDHRFDHLLADESDAAVQRLQARLRDLARRARAIDEARLSPDDRTTRALFLDEVESAADVALACAGHLWTATARENPLADLANLPQDAPVVSDATAAALLARYRAIPAYVDAARKNLELGVARGLVGSDESVRRTIAMIDGELARPLDGWAFMVAAKAGGPTALAPDARARFVAEVGRLVDGEIRAAMARYRATLADVVLPRARTGDRVGLVGLPIGEACYRATIRRETGLARTPAELHAIGEAEIARIDGEIVALGRRLGLAGRGRDPLAAVLARLRDDRALYFGSTEEILAAAQGALERSRRRMPDYLGVLPEASCRVVEIPPHEAPYTTIAYYREPHAEVGKPGEFFVNTFRPEVRPRFEIEALTFHEAIPGHHVQIAIAQQQRALPTFRRHLGSTAFVEGWALYSERLAGELGLYSSDLSRMGQLSYDAWRAARLVVDTGIHAMGWTRERAEAYLRAHTALSPENIANEVDRYVGWPGQALAYKVGQLEILRLRREAEAALGPAFDLRAFHDRLLSGGAVTLGVLGDRLRSLTPHTKRVPGP